LIGPATSRGIADGVGSYSFLSLGGLDLLEVGRDGCVA
jgi:hypothetical protein